MADNQKPKGRPAGTPNTKRIPGSMNDPDIKTVTFPPKGFITTKEFADKCNISVAKLRNDRVAGVFPNESLRWVKREGKRPVIYFDWDLEGHKYLAGLPPSKWPEWYNPNEEVEVPADGEDPGTGPGVDFVGGPVGNIAEAKLKEAKLNIQRKQLELRKAANQVLDIEEVANVLETVGHTLKAALSNLPARLAPLLAAETDVPTIFTMIEQEIFQVLEGLQDLDNFKSEKIENRE